MCSGLAASGYHLRISAAPSMANASAGLLDDMLTASLTAERSEEDVAAVPPQKTTKVSSAAALGAKSNAAPGASSDAAHGAFSGAAHGASADAAAGQRRVWAPVSNPVTRALVEPRGRRSI